MASVTKSVDVEAPLSTVQVNSDLDRFKEFIESRGTETGGWRGDVSAGA